MRRLRPCWKPWTKARFWESASAPPGRWTAKAGASSIRPGLSAGTAWTSASICRVLWGCPPIWNTTCAPWRCISKTQGAAGTLCCCSSTSASARPSCPTGSCWGILPASWVTPPSVSTGGCASAAAGGVWKPMRPSRRCWRVPASGIGSTSSTMRTSRKRKNFSIRRRSTCRRA